MNTDLATFGRELLDLANQHPIQDNLQGALSAIPEKEIDINGQRLGALLTRMVFSKDDPLSCFVVFIRGEDCDPSRENCEKICRAIYNVEWRQGPLCIPGVRWFIRARVEPQSFAA
jgi:hypothetical protein